MESLSSRQTARIERPATTSWKPDVPTTAGAAASNKARMRALQRQSNSTSVTARLYKRYSVSGPFSFFVVVPTGTMPYSYRRASTGSSFAARDAGYIPAARLTSTANPMANATSQKGTAVTSTLGRS